jgi:hypothetical protein
LSLYETQGLRALASLDSTLDTKTPDSEDFAAAGAQSLSSPAEWMDADDEWTLLGSIPRGDGVTMSDMDLILFAVSLGMLCLSSGPREFSLSLFISSFFSVEFSASFMVPQAASPPSLLLSEKSMLKGLDSSGLVS